MAQPDFEDLVETFEFLDDWEDRYRHIIDMGKSMPAMDDALKAPATKVEGCASQVWLRLSSVGGLLEFEGDSDAIIVRGLIAVLKTLFCGVPIGELSRIDAAAQLARLGLDEHLSSQRSNGVRAMVGRIQSFTG